MLSMNFYFNQPGIVLIVSSLISFVLSIYSWKKRNDSNSGYLSYLMISITLWSFAYGIELFQKNLLVMKVLTFLSYFGISTIPVFWFLFAAGYSGGSRFINERKRILLFVFPALAIFMVGTNDFHNLFYSSVKLETFGQYTFQKIESGPFWWVNIIYSHILFISAVIMMIRQIFRVSKNHRWHILFFIGGAFLPYVANSAYVLGYRPYGFLDLTPVAFIFMGVILSFGVYAVKLFDITPVAMDVLFNTIPDAIIVVDKACNIINANSKGKEIINSGEFNSYLDQNFINCNEIAMAGKFFFCTKTPILTGNSDNVGAVIVMRDITEQKNTSLELVKAKNMAETASKAKTEFLTNMSHELKTPLNGVIGYADLLIMSDLGQKEKEFAKNVKESGSLLLKIVDRILDYSVYEKGDMEIDIRKCNFSQLIKSVVSEVESQIRDKKLNFDLNVSPEIPEFIYIDGSKLVQILGNLLSNAVKFTDRGGVGLEVLFLPAGNKGKGELRFIVTDTGIGIKEEKKDEIFKAFVQGDASLTRKHSGTGLGLVISSLLAEKMGGRIEFESQENAGSRFYFTIKADYE